MLEKTENEIMEVSGNAVSLKSGSVELVEIKHILEKAQLIFQEVKTYFY